jgi:hypothetical protein
MQRIHALFGALAISLSFAACGDDEDDDSGGGGNGGTGARGGSAGKGGTAGKATGGTGGSVTGGASGTSGKGGAAGSATGGTDAGMGGEGGDDGGQGGQAGGGGEGGDDTPPTCDPVAPPAVFIGQLSGAQEVPPSGSTGTGTTIAELNAAETELKVSVTWTGLGTNTTAGHIHGPMAPGANAGIVFNLNPPTGATSGSVVGATFPITAAQVASLKGGLYYVNIHSTMFMAGEIRAQLLPAVVIRSGTFSGDAEVPANTSAGTGRAMAVVYPSGTVAAVSVSYSGLSGPASAGHIHGPAAAGANAGILFDLMPPAMASGAVTHAFWTLTTTQSAELLGGLHYANIHSALYMGGEIRAQLLPPCP